MRVWHRLVGTVLLAAFAAAPLGVAAEGYVCGSSGKRMVHQVKAATAACAHCRPTAENRANAIATYERPCCVYVGSTALPPVVTSAAAAPMHDARPALVATPGVTAISGAATALAGVPQFESGGSGVSPPPLTLQTSVILRN
jgi:hypothetical protein